MDPKEEAPQKLEAQIHATRLAHLISRLPPRRQREIVHLIKHEEDPATEGLYLADVGAGKSSVQMEESPLLPLPHILPPNLRAHVHTHSIGEVQLDIGSLRRRVRLLIEAKVEGWIDELQDEVMGWEGREQCLVGWDNLSR